MNSAFTKLLKSLYLYIIPAICLFGCTKVPQDSPQGIAVFVAPSQWMSQYFKEPLDIKSQKDLSKAISAPWYADFSVIREKNSSEMSIGTCEKFFSEKDASLYAAKESEAAAFMGLTAMCQAVNILKEAKPAVKTYIGSSLINELTPDKLPKEFAFLVSSSEESSARKDPSIQFWGDINKDLVATIVSEYQSTYLNAEAQQAIDILGRGDFDGDGIEDVLVAIKSAAVGGSFSDERIFALKNSTGKRWELVGKH